MRIYTSPFRIFSHSRRYESTLNGVVLAHSDVHFLDRVARLQADSPFAICHVGFNALIWKPTRGMKLSTSNHRALLLAPSYHNSSLGKGKSAVFALVLTSGNNTASRTCDPLLSRSRITPRASHIQRVHSATSHSDGSMGVRVWPSRKRS